VRAPRSTALAPIATAVRATGRCGGASAIAALLFLGVCAREVHAAPTDWAAETTAALAARGPKPTLDLIAKAGAEPGDEGRKTLLRIAYESPSVRLRRAAAEAVSARRDRDEAIDSILFRWQNSTNNAVVAERSIDALAALPSPKTVTALAIRRKQSDLALADAVLTAWLEVVRPPASIEEARRILHGDDSARRRAQAAAAVARWSGDKASADKAFDALIQALASERSPAVRDAILSALAPWPDRVVDAAIVARTLKAEPEARATLLQLAPLRPLAGVEDAARKSLKATSTTQICAGLLALGASPAPAAADDADIFAKLSHADPAVRDAAIETVLRRTTDPATRLALLERKDLPGALRLALVAGLAGVATPASLAALIEATKSADPGVVATALGALHRGHGAPGKAAIAEAARTGNPRAKAIAANLEASLAASTRPRAYVVRGTFEHAEDVFETMGWATTAFASGSALADLKATPEDLVYVNGPGEVDAKAAAALETFLELGGTVVLAGGLQNAVLKAMYPEAFDAVPKTLKLESGGLLAGVASDRIVTTAGGAPTPLSAALGAGPTVMVVVAPVVPRTRAARPLLWSLDMEEAYGAAPCVAAELRVGLGRVLATGSVLALKGAETFDGWFGRVRVDRTHPQRYPNTPELRYWVAHDWFGIPPARLELLATKNYFDGADPVAAVPDLPGGRFLAAYLRLR